MCRAKKILLLTVTPILTLFNFAFSGPIVKCSKIQQIDIQSRPIPVKSNLDIKPEDPLFDYQFVGGHLTFFRYIKRTNDYREHSFKCFTEENLRIEYKDHINGNMIGISGNKIVLFKNYKGEVYWQEISCDPFKYSPNITKNSIIVRNTSSEFQFGHSYDLYIKIHNVIEYTNGSLDSIISQIVPKDIYYFINVKVLDSEDIVRSRNKKKRKTNTRVASLFHTSSKRAKPNSSLTSRVHSNSNSVISNVNTINTNQPSVTINGPVIINNYQSPVNSNLLVNPVDNLSSQSDSTITVENEGTENNDTHCKYCKKHHSTKAFKSGNQIQYYCETYLTYVPKNYFDSVKADRLKRQNPAELKENKLRWNKLHQYVRGFDVPKCWLCDDNLYVHPRGSSGGHFNYRCRKHQTYLLGTDSNNCYIKYNGNLKMPQINQKKMITELLEKYEQENGLSNN